MGGSGGFQKAVDAALLAKKLAAVAKAAAVAGIKGAALQAAKEFSPTLIKIAVITVIILILIPFLIVSALPNIFFRFDNSAAADVTAMTDKAKAIESAYKSTRDYNAREVQRIIDELTASGEYDDVVVDESIGNMNDYWFIAICSVAYNQDLFAMDEQAIKDKSIFNYIVE